MATIQDWRVSVGEMSVEVRAENWLGALAAGLPGIGLDLGSMGRLVCATEADGSAVARDPRTGQEVRVEPLSAAAPPSFEMPMSSFAAINASHLRVPAPAEEGPQLRVVPPAPPAPPRGAPELRLEPAPPQRREVPARPEPLPPAQTLLDDEGFAEVTLDPVPVAPPAPRTLRLEPPPAPSPLRLEPPPRVAPPPPSLTVEQQGPGRVVAPAAVADARLEERLEELFMRLGEIMDAPDPASACAVALRLANELIPCDAGAVLIRTRAGDALRFRAALGPAAATVLDTTIPLDRGIAGFCFQLGVALTIGDTTADNRHYNRVDRSTGYRTRSMLAAPVRADSGGVYGVLELLNPPRPYSDDDLELASRVAATLGSYFQGMDQ